MFSVEVTKSNDSDDPFAHLGQNSQTTATSVPDISQFDPLNFSNFEDFCKIPTKTNSEDKFTKQRSIEIEVSPVFDPKNIPDQTGSSSSPQIPKQAIASLSPQSDNKQNPPGLISRSISCENVAQNDLISPIPGPPQKPPERRRARQHSFVAGRFTISKDELLPQIDEIFEDSPSSKKSSSSKFEVDVEVDMPPVASPKQELKEQSSTNNSEPSPQTEQIGIKKQKSLEEVYEELLDF